MTAGIARIVFRQAERHFTYKVSTDIRRLCKNTAPALANSAMVLAPKLKPNMVNASPVRA
jgi:hypothetical protein